MKIHPFPIVILFLLFTGITFAQNNEDKAVRNSFDNYKNAILNDNGAEAVKHVSERTIRYYDAILDHVKNSDSAKVDSLSILDKLMVFSLRHRSTRNEILTFNGRSLFVYAIKSGMVGKNSVANLTIGEVTIDNNTAKGQIESHGNKSPMSFDFYKEGEGWKVDLTSIFPMSVSAFQKMAENAGETENQFLFSLLERVTGKKPGPEIWKKMN